MKKRAELYTVGGLIFGGIYSAALLAGAFLVRSVSESAAFLFLGGVPYAAYLFFLNLPPFRYENGPDGYGGSANRSRERRLRVNV